MTVIRARHDGNCPDCNRAIRRLDPITNRRGHWTHFSCRQPRGYQQRQHPYT